MMRVIPAALAVCLVAVGVHAEYILYETGSGAILEIFEDDAKISRDRIRDGESAVGGIHWERVSLGKGSATTNMTNISEVKDFEATTPEDEEADIENMPRQLRAAIRGLVKILNQRLPAGEKINEAELREAIKDEL